MLSQEIQKRIPLWKAISQLYIDNEIGEYEYINIVNEILKYGCSFKKAEEILQFEVAPVCFWNLYISTGSWTGFNTNDLVVKILKNIRKQEIFFPYRWYFKSYLVQFFITNAVYDDWEKVKTIYQERMSQI